VRPAHGTYDARGAEEFDRRLAESLSGAGVRGIARARLAPFQSPFRTTVSAINGEGKRTRSTSLGYGLVTSPYFDVLALPLVSGRVFSIDEERSNEPVVVVTEATARLLWPDENGVGKRLRWRSVTASSHDLAETSSEVIGVVADVASRSAVTSMPGMYAPLPPVGSDAWTEDPLLIVRTNTVANEADGMIRQAVHRLDPTVWATWYPLQASVTNTESAGVERTMSSVAGGLGILALLLASIGLYGVLSFAVAQRTQEIGIRVALGATRLNVIALVLAGGVRALVVATIAGNVIGVAGARALAAAVAGVPSFDPTVILAGSASVCVVGLLAALVPAWRSSRIEPMIALRIE
jgi:hypothetical protein